MIKLEKIKRKYKKFIFFPASFDDNPDKKLKNIIKSQFKTYFRDLPADKINKKIKQNIKLRKISKKTMIKL